MADHTAARHWSRMLAAVRDYDPSALLLPADPRESRYAVLRPSPMGLEGLLVERGVLLGSYTLETLETADFLELREPATRSRTSRVPSLPTSTSCCAGSAPSVRRLASSTLDDGTQIATERVAAAAMALGAEVLAAAQANPTIERGLA